MHIPETLLHHLKQPEPTQNSIQSALAVYVPQAVAQIQKIENQPVPFVQQVIAQMHVPVILTPKTGKGTIWCRNKPTT